MKQLQYASKTSKTFEMCVCNMHHILVRHPPLFASGRRSRSRKRGRRASAPGEGFRAKARCFSLRWQRCRRRRAVQAEQEQWDGQRSNDRCSKASARSSDRSSAEQVQEQRRRSSSRWGRRLEHRKGHEARSIAGWGRVRRLLSVF